MIYIRGIKFWWRFHFKKRSARLAFDGAQCVMGAERTMKHLKHIIRATMATMDFLPLMRVSFFEWTFETTF